MHASHTCVAHVNLYAYQLLCAICELFAYVHVATMPHLHCLNMCRLCMFCMHANCICACSYGATCALLEYVQAVHVLHACQLHMRMLLQCHMCVLEYICVGYACSCKLHMCMLLWCHMCVT